MKHRKSTKKKNLLEVGLDTIEIDIKTEYELVDNNYDFFSKRTGLVVGTMRHKQGKEHGYRLNINLPKCLRETNNHPFTVLRQPFSRSNIRSA